MRRDLSISAQARGKGGFTLLELLVSISIIAVLASLLFSGFAGVKTPSRLLSCSNNLKQLQLAVYLYTMDNCDFFPANRNQRGLDNTYPNWVGGFMYYESQIGPKGRSILADSTNEAILVSNNFGHIGRYSQNPKIYKCPADQSYVILEDGKHSRVRSYAMNWYIGSNLANEMAGMIPRWMFFCRASDLTSVSISSIFLLVDEHEDSIVDGTFYVNDPSADGYWLGNAAPASHHGRSTPFAFCDGHVENKVWQDKRTLVPVSRTAWPGVKFDTPNRDCDWLFEHSTRRIDSP
jgi:prepilin-type N-terminal cleavage/methylation domain-containing protein/prepilin-type processing-associated H-X9-DG protein